MFVGVAYVNNQIPEVYGDTEMISFLRFDLDEDMIYASTRLEIRPDQFEETLKVQKIEAFVYDTMTSEVEAQLKATGIKAYSGKKGNCKKVAKELFVK